MATKSSTLKEVAYGKIRQMIISGQLLPGEKLTERQLVEQLNMGRTPVREALLDLSYDHLVQIHPRKFVEIAPISPEIINEIFEVRICLEPAVLQRHFSTINPVRLMEIYQGISENVKKYEQCLAESNSTQTLASYPSGVVELDEQFHTVLIESANNCRINQIYRNFIDYTSLLWGINSRLVAQRSYESDREHLTIIRSIMNNRIDNAAQLLVQHLERSRNVLIYEMIEDLNDFKK